MKAHITSLRAMEMLDSRGTPAARVFAVLDNGVAAGASVPSGASTGETEDTFMADFAVTMGGGQIRSGSACKSERIAQYNRLLEIEAEFGASARFDNPLA